MIEQTCAEIADKALNKSYVIGYISGLLTISFSWGVFTLPELLFKKKKMFTAITSMSKYNKGIITVLDLVAAAEVSPEKATRFMIEFARKLNVEPEVEESTGTRFYRFVNGNQISEHRREKEIADRYK